MWNFGAVEGGPTSGARTTGFGSGAFSRFDPGWSWRSRWRSRSKSLNDSNVPYLALSNEKRRNSASNLDLTSTSDDGSAIVD